MKSQVALVVVIQGFFMASVVGCSNHKTEVPGKDCLLNTDCHNPLSCSWKICHEACVQDRDCPDNRLCVLDTSDGAEQRPTGLRVCVLPVDDDLCKDNSTCPGLLVCGSDLHCRNECLDDVDCINEGDKCVVGGVSGKRVCVRPASIGGNGELIPAPDGGMVPPDGGSEVGASVDSGGGGGGGTDAVVLAEAGVGAIIGPCGIAETEPNETPATATPFTPGTTLRSCIGTDTDVDDYVFAVPAGDLAGGTFQGAVTEIGDGPISLKLVSETNNGTITAFASAANGVSRYFYWAGAVGQRYHLSVYQVGGRKAFTYTLSVAYTPVKDDYEPNDTRLAAKMLTVGTPATAYAFTGYASSAIATAEYQDWYVVDLAAGPTTVTVPTVPDDVSLAIQVSNATTNVNLAVTPGGSPNAGGAFTSTFAVVTPGRYNLRIAVNSVLPVGSKIAATMVTLPVSFTTPYQLTVTQ